MESTQGKGGKGTGGWGRKIRKVGKRINLPTAVCSTTEDLELEIEHVQISLDQSKPLLTAQIQPENQAETFQSLIVSGATANFISPTIVEKFHIPKISLTSPRNIRMLDGSLPKTGKVWHKVMLRFLCQGIPSSGDFLVCPIGNNQAILGMPWLKDQNPNVTTLQWQELEGQW
jgi:hypothetical protein